ncbi:MAG: hypothetical protein FWG48_02645 [Oscillospiraceae bacterium]|nr:hypothetical protein [Oscillospiraceae bacterium]
MIIDVCGAGLRILDDFIYYASTYPNRLADAMWWCEDSFVNDIRELKKAYDGAVPGQACRRCPCCGE